METLRIIQSQARELLNAQEHSIQTISELDLQFINKKLSPGGCADLLALTYFLHFMEENVNER